MAHSPPSSPFYWNDYSRDTRILSLAAKGAWMDILCRLHESLTRGTATLTLTQWAGWCGCSQEQFLEAIEEIRDAGIADVEVCNAEITPHVTPHLTGDVTDGVTPLSRRSNAQSNARVTVSNRRMIREEKSKESNALRQGKYRSKESSNGDVTPKVTPLSRRSNAQSNARVTPKVTGEVTPLSRPCHTVPSSSSSSSSSKEKEIKEKESPAAASLGAPSQGPLGVGSEAAKGEKPDTSENPQALKVHSLTVDKSPVSCQYHVGSGHTCRLPVTRNHRSRPRCGWHAHVESNLGGIGTEEEFGMWHLADRYLSRIPVEECWAMANHTDSHAESPPRQLVSSLDD